MSEEEITIGTLSPPFSSEGIEEFNRSSVEISTPVVRQSQSEIFPPLSLNYYTPESQIFESPKKEKVAMNFPLKSFESPKRERTLNFNYSSTDLSPPFIIKDVFPIDNRTTFPPNNLGLQASSLEGFDQNQFEEKEIGNWQLDGNHAPLFGADVEKGISIPFNRSFESSPIFGGNEIDSDLGLKYLFSPKKLEFNRDMEILYPHKSEMDIKYKRKSTLKCKEDSIKKRKCPTFLSKEAELKTIGISSQTKRKYTPIYGERQKNVTTCTKMNTVKKKSRPQGKKIEKEISKEMNEMIEKALQIKTHLGMTNAIISEELTAIHHEKVKFYKERNSVIPSEIVKMRFNKTNVGAMFEKTLQFSDMNRRIEFLKQWVEMRKISVGNNLRTSHSNCKSKEEFYCRNKKVKSKKVFENTNSASYGVTRNAYDGKWANSSLNLIKPNLTSKVRGKRTVSRVLFGCRDETTSNGQNAYSFKRERKRKVLNSCNFDATFINTRKDQKRVHNKAKTNSNPNKKIEKQSENMEIDINTRFSNRKKSIPWYYEGVKSFGMKNEEPQSKKIKMKDSVPTLPIASIKKSSRGFYDTEEPKANNRLNSANFISFCDKDVKKEYLYQETSSAFINRLSKFKKVKKGSNLNFWKKRNEKAIAEAKSLELKKDSEVKTENVESKSKKIENDEENPTLKLIKLEQECKALSYFNDWCQQKVDKNQKIIDRYDGLIQSLSSETK